MKTPRQVLCDQHRSAEPQLDAIRRQALGSLAEPLPAPARATPAGPGSSSLRPFLLPLRWHLSGLAAAWIVVAFLSLQASPPPVSAAARHGLPTPRQIVMALLENRRQVVEQIDLPATEPAPASRPGVPHRRSELSHSTAVA